MRTFVLASGSSGNSFLIEDNEKNKYLIDIGLSYKKIKEILLEKNISPQEISGVFITHEHSDHILGLEVFMKNVNCPIYLTKGTFKALNFKNNLNNERFIFVKSNQILKLENLKVFVVGKSHDVIEPVSFVFENGIKVGIFTDLGEVDNKILEILKNLDIVYFETNFCEEILKNVDYNPQYISRLHSNLGHLSVQDSIEIIKNFVRNDQKIILSHISENTNTYENSYNLVKNSLNELNIDCELYVSFQGQSSDWIE